MIVRPSSVLGMSQLNLDFQLSSCCAVLVPYSHSQKALNAIPAPYKPTFHFAPPYYNEVAVLLVYTAISDLSGRIIPLSRVICE